MVRAKMKVVGGEWGKSVVGYVMVIQSVNRSKYLGRYE
jgi:hypothetical protein